MSSFRLRVEPLEARENPAAPADVFVAEAFAESNRDLLAFIQGGPGFYSNPSFQAGTQFILDTVADRSRRDAAGIIGARPPPASGASGGRVNTARRRTAPARTGGRSAGRGRCVGRANGG